MKSYKVTYKVINNEEVFVAGPYDSYDEAVYQKNDIAGYEGIYDAAILPVEEDGQ